jgi:hypothetical protein
MSSLNDLLEALLQLKRIMNAKQNLKIILRQIVIVWAFSREGAGHGIIQ